MKNLLRTSYSTVLIAIICMSQSFVGHTQTEETCDKPVTFYISDVDGVLGDTVTVDIRISELENLISFQFTLLHDVADLRFVDCVSSDLDPFPCPNDLYSNKSTGFTGVVWLADYNENLSLADSSLLISIRFEIVGNPGTQHDIFISDFPRSTGFSVVENPEDSWAHWEDVDSWCQEGGDVQIRCPELEIYPSSCGGLEQEHTSLEFYTCGGASPYEWTVRDSVTMMIIVSGVSEDHDTIRVTDLSPGKSYEIHVIDALGNKDADNIFIPLSEPLDLDILVWNPRCDTGWVQSKGTVFATPVGGNGDYQYRWSNGLYDTSRLNYVIPGVYSVTVEDSDGCEILGNFDVPVPPLLEVEVIDVIGADCRADSVNERIGPTGEVTLKARGGWIQEDTMYNEYRYYFEHSTGRWDIDDHDSNLIYNRLLIPGEWNVSLRTPFNQCYSDTITFTVPWISDIEPTFVFGNTVAECVDGTTDVVLDMRSSRVPGRVELINQHNDTIITDITTSLATLEDIPVGEYLMTYTPDGYYCSWTNSFDVVPISTLSVDTSSLELTQPACSDNLAGSVSFDVTGTVGNVLYSWSDGIQTNVADRNDLLGGERYEVTITDDFCEITQKIELIDSITLDLQAIKQADCDDIGTGALEFVSNLDDVLYTLQDSLQLGQSYTSIDGRFEDLEPNIYVARAIGLDGCVYQESVHEISCIGIKVYPTNVLIGQEYTIVYNNGTLESTYDSRIYINIVDAAGRVVHTTSGIYRGGEWSNKFKANLHTGIYRVYVHTGESKVYPAQPLIVVE